MFTDRHGVPISEAAARDLELIEWHVEHTMDHLCLREDRLGRERSGTGCEEERLVWQQLRGVLRS